MIKGTAEYNNKEQRFKMPERWEEVTFLQYAAIMDNLIKGGTINNADIPRQLSILTGIAEKDLRQIEYRAMSHLTAIAAFSFDLDYLNKFNKVPEKFIKYKYKNGRIAKWEIGLLPWEHGIAVDKFGDLLADMGKGQYFICEELCRQYAEIEIAEKPITEVFGLCNFFLSSYLISKHVIKN